MFHNIEWTQPVIENRSTCTNKSCAIVIPVYKSKLTQNEIMSFKQVISCLGKEYQIWIVGPENLDTECYKQVSDSYKFNTAFCNPAFFKSTETYSYLCETSEFYKIFKDFTYILIYQLDGWVFENNNLKYFLEGGFDYIGSPWMAGNFDFKRDAVGNGGVSLRKVSKFIELCDSLNKYDFESKWVKLEDLFFCKYVKSIKRNIEFNIADVQTASGFCIDAFHSYFVKMNKGKLPMFAHGWSRPSSYDVFWKKYIPIQKEKNEIKRNMAFNYFGDYFSNNTIGYNFFENAFTSQSKEKRKPMNITNKKPAAKPSDGEKIIVTFTTWKQRINNVPHIIDSIMKNTMRPDKICINLSVEDFPNLESDFSQEVKGKIKQYGEIVEVNWLSNNTKVWKKLIPTLCKYPNDVVISIDDDWEYPNDIIQTLYDDYCKYDKKYPISGNNLTLYNMKCHCGSGSLTTYKLLNGKGQFNTLSEECVSYGSDDIFYTYCAYVNGNEYKQASKMYFTNMIPYRANNAFSTGSNVNIGKTLDAAKKSFENNAKTDQISKICKSIFDYNCTYVNLIDNMIKPPKDKLLKAIDTDYSKYIAQLKKAYKTPCNFYGKVYNNEKAIISLTTWKARINTVGKTIYNLLTMCPEFHIVLVLSSDEFPNKKELPVDILLLAEHNQIEILWVKENWKAYKKVIFTINKYPNVPIISADDDCYYIYDYAEDFYNTWLSHKDCFVSTWYKMVGGIPHTAGCATLYPPCEFGKVALKCLNKDIIEYTNQDDNFYTEIKRVLKLKKCIIKGNTNAYIFHDESQPIHSEYHGKKYSFNAVMSYLKKNVAKTYKSIDIDKIPIIVSMTSFPKRIHNVSTSIDLLLYKQELPPDEIHLWLSIEEFPNKEKSLPDKLLKTINENNNVYLHWCDSNTYVHKRHNIFKLVKTKSYVFLIDDDVEYDKTLIKTVVKCANENPGAIILYHVYSFHKYNGKRIMYTPDSTNIKNKIETNVFRWCGQSMIPSDVYPIEALDEKNQKIRNNTSPVSDECWIQPWIVYKDIPLYACNFNWGVDIDKNNGKNTGLTSWTHQKDSNGLEKRDNWLNAVLEAYPNMYKKYQDLFNYDK